MLKIFLKENEEKEKLAGFRWIFSNEIKNFEGQIVSGDICKVYTSKRQFLCYGFFNANSKIWVRILSFNESDIIDKEFFRKKIKDAISLRNNLNFLDSNCKRLIFSDSDLLPGLVVDQYADILVCEFSTLGMDKIKADIVDILVQELAPRGIFERSDNISREKEGLEQTKGFLYGEFDTKVLVEENGIKFYVDILNGQKTGYFLDQKLNRKSLELYAKDKVVLDCFSNIGGFALNALKAGAKEVYASDISALACSQIEENASLNNFKNIKVIKEDTFKLLESEELKDKFDLIVLDPPAFTKGKDTVKNAYRGYLRINELAMKLIKRGGILMTFSCSQHMRLDLFLEMLKEASTASGRDVQFLSISTQAPDHPSLLSGDEQLYLKSVVLRIL